MDKNSASSGSKPTKKGKCLVENNGSQRAARYNYKNMKDVTLQAKIEFAHILSELRTNRGASAREMSLSLGQGASYINDIENGRMLPSMAMFFEICEYLEVTPLEFFTYTADITDDASILRSLAVELSEEDLILLAELAKRLLK